MTRRATDNGFEAPSRVRGKRRAKADLPQKLCAACGRPFAWRRKWSRDWEHVRYCSDRCRGAGTKR